MKKILIAIYVSLFVLTSGFAGSFMVDCAQDLENGLHIEGHVHSHNLVHIMKNDPLNYQAFMDEFDRHDDAVFWLVTGYGICCCTTQSCPC